MAPFIVHTFHDLGCVWRENRRSFKMGLGGISVAGLESLSELKHNSHFFTEAFLAVAVEKTSYTLNFHRFIGECRKGGACLLVSAPPTLS